MIAFGVFSLTNFKLLKSKNTTVQFHPASWTKLLVYIALKEAGVKLTDVIILPNKIIVTKTSTLNKKEKVLVRDLIILMLVSSNNFATVILARHYLGLKYIEKLNDLALRIGMKNSCFCNASGFHGDSFVTIEDFLLLGQFLYQRHQEIFEFIKMDKYNFSPLNKKDEVFEIESTCLFQNAEWNLGSKTGTLFKKCYNIATFISTSENEVKLILIHSSHSKNKLYKKLLELI